VILFYFWIFFFCYFPRPLACSDVSIYWRDKKWKNMWTKMKKALYRILRFRNLRSVYYYWRDQWLSVHYNILCSQFCSYSCAHVSVVQLQNLAVWLTLKSNDKLRVFAAARRSKIIRWSGLTLTPRCNFSAAPREGTTGEVGGRHSA